VAKNCHDANYFISVTTSSAIDSPFSPSTGAGFLAGELPPILHRVKGILVRLKLTALPSNFVPNSGLRKFRHGKSMVSS